MEGVNRFVGLTESSRMSLLYRISKRWMRLSEGTSNQLWRLIRDLLEQQSDAQRVTGKELFSLLVPTAIYVDRFVEKKELVPGRNLLDVVAAASLLALKFWTEAWCGSLYDFGLFGIDPASVMSAEVEMWKALDFALVVSEEDVERLFFPVSP